MSLRLTPMLANGPSAALSLSSARIGPAGVREKAAVAKSRQVRFICDLRSRGHILHDCASNPGLRCDAAAVAFGVAVPYARGA